MTKTAVFSTGFADTYKGKRDVRAAWMVTTPEGAIVSGHSISRAVAAKTAQTAAGERCPHREFTMHGGGNRGRYSFTPAAIAHYLPFARKAGFDSIKAYNAAARERRAAWIAKCKIELVEI